MPEPGQNVPEAIQRKINRGRSRKNEDATLRRECWEFFRGNQYVYRDRKNFLQNQGTLQGQKEPYRVRQTWNLLTEPIQHEVSASTSRVPAYDVTPSTQDPDKIAAAALAKKVAAYGYDKWRILNVVQTVVTNALVADEGFAWPYFDNTVGAPVGEDEQGNVVCEGEIRVRTFTANEVYWEPGVKFMDSRWHCIEQARPVDEVLQTPGLLKDVKKLDPDARQSDVGEGKSNGELVMVTEYLERPSPRNPDGLRLMIANNRVICAPEPYPCVDPTGAPLDEPVLHHLSRILDPDSDRDKGLVRFCLDAVRSFNTCTNKIHEWVTLALNPQIILQNMKLGQRLTDEPGKVYTAVGSGQVIWRPVPPIPQELFQLREEAKQHVRSVFSQNDIPSGVEAGKAIQVLLERDDNTRQAFTIRLADFHSRLMRHCLYLVQKHYTEPRVLKIKGLFGWESLDGFKGADLRGECDVTVLPGSIEPRTKQAVEQRVMNYAQLGWVDPQKAMAAIDAGTAEDLIEDFELDKAKAYRMIRKIQALATGGPGADVPSIDPEVDNPDVILSIVGMFMKTEEFEIMAEQAPWAGEAAKLVAQQCRMVQQQRAQEQAMMQSMQAEQMGAQNAAQPQAKPLPSMPALPS